MALSQQSGRDPLVLLREVEARNHFERLIASLSARFVILPSETVEAEISGALRSLAEFLDIERTTLFQRTADGRFTNTHFWVAPGLDAPPADDDVAALFPYFVGQLLQRKPVCFARVSDLPDEAAVDKRNLAKHTVRSNVTLPLFAGDRLLGAIAFGTLTRERSWAPEVVERLTMIGHVFATALERARSDLALRDAFAELTRLKERLEADNSYLRQELGSIKSDDVFVGQTDGVKRVLHDVRRVGPTDSTVLVLGETGTGKELVAEAIHRESKRRDRLLVRVNCAALPAGLVESELFGRERGAYTGALTREAGRFEVADGGTIFLDEVGELPMDLQAKLLRVIETGTFERLGSSRTMAVDVRLVAATNRDLEQAVRERRFREDLFFRLNVFPIAIPPLRERREDIPLLVWTFVQRFGQQLGKVVETIPRRAMDALQAYDWPGNVRELQNVIERSMILTDGPTLQVALPDPNGLHAAPTVGSTLEEVERQHIASVLEKTGWRVSGQAGAARVLGMKPTTLEYRMKKLGIERQRPSRG